MKTILPKLMLSCLLMAGGIGKISANSGYTSALPAIDSIFVHKQVISKAHKIYLYPDANHSVLFFSVKGEEGKAYQLFIFDLEGKLIKQTEIRNKQTTVIRELDKGVYLFDVFSDDVKIGNGQLTVR